ncbi:MAG: ABC transporter ATP-binding protein/permease [Candidatus Midichloria sp.]|nr:ABC transporter ATP-binding protein/permease [Candidatus Midichloria sp.]
MLKTKMPKKIGAFLWYFLKKQPWAFSFITITATISTLSNNTIWPYITGNLVDAFNKLNSSAPEADLNIILVPLAVALAFWVFIEFVQRSKGVLLGFAMPKFEANIRISMFNYVSNHSHSYFVQTHVGGIAQRISDMPKSAKLVIDDLLTVFVPLIISIIASSSVFLSMHLLLAAIFFTWLGLHFTLCVFFCLKAANSVSVQSAARALLQGKIVDSMTNHLSVKLFTAHQHEMQTIKEAQADELKKYRYSLIYIEKFKILLSLISIINITLLLYLAIKLWQQGQVTIGDIVFAINSTLGLMTNLWFAGDEISYMFYEIGVCKQSLILLEEPTEISESTLKQIKVTQGKIEFDNVSFNYRNNDNIFKNKSLVIHGGQKVGLVGFSGSGKTTFANLIMRLYEVSSGTVKIDDQDISQVSLLSLRSNIAFIPQDPFLFHRSVLENIKYGNINAIDEEVKEVAKKAECDSFIMNLEHGYDTIVGERGSKLSGGQRQRIAIARAMLKNAPIVIMDEATSALDSVTEKLIEKSLQHLMANKTAIVIAHRLSTLLHLDRILVFEKGNIVEDGTHEELLTKRGRYAMLWHMQQRGLLPEHDN